MKRWGYSHECHWPGSSATLPDPESSESLLIAAIQTTSAEHICQETEGGSFILFPKPLNRRAQALLAGKHKYLDFFLCSDISKHSKNSYYLKGVLEKCLSLSKLESSENMKHYLYHSCTVLLKPHSIQTVTRELRLSLGLPIVRHKVHPLIKGWYGHVSRIIHTQNILQKSYNAPSLQVIAK